MKINGNDPGVCTFKEDTSDAGNLPSCSEEVEMLGYNNAPIKKTLNIWSKLELKKKKKEEIFRCQVCSITQSESAELKLIPISSIEIRNKLSINS